MILISKTRHEMQQKLEWMWEFANAEYSKKTLQGKILNIKFDFLFFLSHFVQVFHKLGGLSFELLPFFASFIKNWTI